MRRRELLGLLACASASACVEARAGGGTSISPSWRCLPDHLSMLAARARHVRRRALDALITVDRIRQRQAWIRETLWTLVGGMPARTPLGIRSVGALDRPGYRVEKLLYESQPELYVPALLYVPTGRRGPFPGVLFQAGHLPAGKAAAPYQRCCQALARLGHVVLAFDPMGQGERVYYPVAGGTRSRFATPDEEHDMAGRQMLLVGDTATRLQLWDAVRSLDVLAACPRVDGARLAAIGQSGGGTLTMLLAAVDDRLAAAAVSSANTQDMAGPDFDPPGPTDDAEQNLIGAGPLGLDRWDLLHPHAPRPLLVLVSARDAGGVYAPGYLTASRDGFDTLRRVYATLGRTSPLRWVETPLPHGLSPPARLAIERFLARWLGGDPPPRAEPPVTPEPEEALWVVPGGSIVRALGGATPFRLTEARARSLPAPRAPAHLASLLGLRSPGPPPAARVIGVTRSGPCTIEDLAVPSAPEVWVPAWTFAPRAPRALLLALEPEGRSLRWTEDGLWQTLARKGSMVCAFDVRGIGDLRPEVGRGPPEYTLAHATEESYAWGSLSLGESLLAQRVTDILTLVAALSTHPPAAGLAPVLIARGDMTVPALFAAALEPRIRTLYLAGGLASYRSVAETEDYVCPLANILPGVLAHTDLPKIAASMGPTPVILGGPVDGRGRPMPLTEARALYREAANVAVVPEAAWDVETLSRFVA